MLWKKNCFQNKNLKIIFLLWELFICMTVCKSLIFFGAFCKPTIKKRSCWNCCCTIFYLKEQLFSCSLIKINKENVPREHSHNQNFWYFGLQLFASKKMTSQDITKSNLISKIKIRETHFYNENFDVWVHKKLSFRGSMW